MTTDLETLSDAELIERTQGAIWLGACLSSKRLSRLFSQRASPGRSLGQAA